MRTLLGLILVIALFLPALAQTPSTDAVKKPSPAPKAAKNASDLAAKPKANGESSKKSKAAKKDDENVVQEGAVTTGKAVGRVGKDTGELAGKGAVETGKAVSRGAKWLARPWSKSGGTEKAKSKR